MSTTHRLSAVTLAFVLTLAMLIGIDSQATAQPYAPILAHAAVTTQG